MDRPEEVGTGRLRLAAGMTAVHPWDGSREPLYDPIVRTLAVLLRLGFRVRSAGWQLPPSGPVLLAANHLSVLDPVVLATVILRGGRRVRFLAVSGLWDKPVVGWTLREGRMIAVHRGEGPLRMADDACVALDAGEVVLVYPEGTLPRSEPLTAQPGAGLLALRTTGPVVPVAVWGLGPLRERRLGRRRVAVVFGDPIDVSAWGGRTDREASRQVADFILEEIRALLPLARRLAVS